MSARGRPLRSARPREDLAAAVVAVLAQVRHEAGLTRHRLAALSGVSSNTIAKIEQAAVTDPGFTVVATIAAALDLPLDQLLRRARDTMSVRRSEGAVVDRAMETESMGDR